jgi:hypothetical protein
MFVSRPNWVMRNAPSLEPFGLMALFSLLTGLSAILTLRVLDRELVLPAFSILLFAEAAIAAIVARLLHVQEKSANVTLWDFAGAFALIGCAAAVLGEPDEAALFSRNSLRGVRIGDRRRSIPGRAPLAASTLRCRTGQVGVAQLRSAARLQRSEFLNRPVWQERRIVADVSMSLDNVLAVAGAAREHPAVLIFGLILSIAMMGAAASLIARLLQKRRWIAYLGLLIILYVAVEMIFRGTSDIMKAALH